MSQPDYLISTPENVDLHLELAGIGNRILACVVDTLISMALNFVIILGCLLVAFAMDSFPLPQQAKTVALYYVLGAGVLTILVVSFGYHIFFEGFWHGQTPGKRLAHIRVIEQNGQAVSWTSVIIRNLIRIVDTWIFLIGLVVVLIDRNERRLGDLAAGTLVIRER
ncbi:MAG TPA: RDD family protein, partial [Candidatus Obscuribacterales bacterium]